MKNNAVLVLCALLAVSCSEDVFRREQYANIFGFVSEQDNTLTKTVSLHAEAATVYVSLSMGGTRPPQEDVHVMLAKAPQVLQAWNVAHFDLDESRYALPLPDNAYGIPDYECVISAGTFSGAIPVTIYPEFLSPDESYYLPLCIDSYDKCLANPDKSTLLLHVTIKNRWAEAAGTSWSYAGIRTDMQTGLVLNMPGTKTLQCLSGSRVRTMVANEPFSASMALLGEKGMILEVGDETEDGKYSVNILPWRYLDVEPCQGDPDYPNTYFLDDDGYNVYHTFRLHYRYRLAGNSYEMREELRLKYNEDNTI